MDRVGANQDEMWDEEDGFFYDVLRLPDGSAQRVSKCAPSSGCCRSRRWRCSRRISSRSCRNSATRALQFNSASSRTRCEHALADAAGCCQSPHAVDRRRNEVAPHPRAHARRVRNSSARTVFARCRNSTSSIPMCSFTTDTSIGWTMCPATPIPACSAGTPTGVGRCGCRSTICFIARWCACMRTTVRISKSNVRPAPGR